MAHLSSRTRRALRVRDSDARHEHHWARLRQLSCGTSRKASTRHTVHRGSAQHVPPRTLVGSVMMKEACLSADLQCEKQELDGLEEVVRAYCASGEYGLLTKLTSPRGHSLAGNRGTGLPTVRACGELRRVPLGLPLVGVGGAGPCGGAVSPAHPGAGVGAVHRSPRQTCPIFRDKVLSFRTNKTFQRRKKKRSIGQY